MITNEFDIDEAAMLRDVQIEDQSGCDIRECLKSFRVG